jgi:P4 family phage/plasmid primase-like protien
LEAALAWHNAGVSTVPILPNGTKRPAVQWGVYQAKAPELGQVDLWWRNGSEYGLALICGSVSGNLEMLELEGRVTDGASMTRLMTVLDAQGQRELWDLLSGPDGYAEWSPSGGMHLLYRITDHPVPGNAKVAAGPDNVVYAETRGEGGYVIVAPTGGLCHPSGQAWIRTRGAYGVLPEITWSQRCALHEAIKLALDERPQLPAPSLSKASPVGRSDGAGLSPGDDFEAHSDWAQILEPHGWVLESQRGPERFWTRPGKNPRDGASATTGGAADRDRLYVFSTSTIFDAEVPYTKFGAYALLNFGGNHSEAASALVRFGYGSRTLDPGLPYIESEPGNPQQVEPASVYAPGPVKSRPRFRLDEAGNAERLWDRTEGRFHYVAEQKSWYTWSGSVWKHDVDGSLTREVTAMTEAMFTEAELLDNTDLAKWAKNSRSLNRINATKTLMQAQLGATISTNQLDQDRHLVNLDNGILDLATGELEPHDPSKLITRMFGTRFDPQAACPNFEKFMEDVLPDPQVRAYVQRCLGYTLLGDADQRSLFLVHGPSGTGKSQFIETIRYLFGGYGTTAPAGTFKHAKADGPNNDLHMLRGKRFVATSETADNAVFDEDLIKRITGRDEMSSRGLYEQFQSWTPECAVWIATNHPPKFNSDDDAIWRRAKLVPFTTQFSSDGEHKEIPDIARNVLRHELPGILNWVLAGLASYRQLGLAEPDSVLATAKEHRAQSDQVVRFLEDCIEDGRLVLGEDQDIHANELMSMYDTWCRAASERKMGSFRFANRLTSAGRGLVTQNHRWYGVGRATGVSVLGTMVPFHRDKKDLE